MFPFNLLPFGTEIALLVGGVLFGIYLTAFQMRKNGDPRPTGLIWANLLVMKYRWFKIHLGPRVNEAVENVKERASQ